MNRLPAITAMLVCRDQILRLGLQTMLAARQDIRLIDPPAGATETEEFLAREQPQVIIVDAEAETDLAALMQKIKALVPRGKILLLIGFETTCWKTFCSCTDGVILKVQPPGVLIAYIENVCRLATTPSEDSGSVCDNPALKGSATEADKPVSYGPHRYGSLTEREREIVALIGQGLANKDIASRLCISVITVRHHLTNIFDKLGVTTRQELLIRAHQYGLVGLSVPA